MYRNFIKNVGQKRMEKRIVNEDPSGQIVQVTKFFILRKLYVKLNFRTEKSVHLHTLKYIFQKDRLLMCGILGLTGDTVPVLLENSIRLNPPFIIHKFRLNFLKGLGILAKNYLFLYFHQNNIKKIANEYFKKSEIVLSQL